MSTINEFRNNLILYYAYKSNQILLKINFAIVFNNI